MKNKQINALFKIMFLAFYNDIKTLSSEGRIARIEDSGNVFKTLKGEPIGKRLLEGRYFNKYLKRK